MSDTHFDHPLPVGTILETADEELHKVVVDVLSLSPNGAAYRTYMIESASEQPVIQNQLDFEYMANSDEYPDWRVMYDRREDDNG